MSARLRRVEVLTAMASTALLLVQTGSNVGLWMREPLTSTYGIEEAPPVMPSVSVCPNPPFDVGALLGLGLNVSSDSAEELARRVEELEGVDVPLKEVWDKAAWPLGAVVRYAKVGGRMSEYAPWQVTAPGWRRSFTPLGPCLTFTPAEPAFVVELQMHGFPLKSCEFALDEEMDLESCNTIESRCNTSCAWETFVYKVNNKLEYDNINLILHSPEDPPTISATKSVISRQEKVVAEIDVFVNSRRVERLGSATSACISDPAYSEAQCRQRCVEPCHPRALSRRPEHPTWNIANHQFACIRPVKDVESVEYQNLTDVHHRCLKECKPRCSDHLFTHFEINRVSYQAPPYFRVIIQHQTQYQTKIGEIKAYPLSRLLADLGGSLGLFLGLSLLSFWMMLVRRLQGHKTPASGSEASPNASARQGPQAVSESKQNIQRAERCGDSLDSPALPEFSADGEKRLSMKLWGWVGVMAMTVVMSAHIITAICAYIWQPAITLLSVDKTPQSFPQVTVCPDMPFKSQVLVEHGINTSDYGFLYVTRDRILHNLLQTLPGVWANNTAGVEVLWKEAARDVCEIVGSSVNFDCSKAKSNAILTTNNICYALTPSDVTGKILTLSMTYDDLAAEGEMLAWPLSSSQKKLWIAIPERGVQPVLIARHQTYAHEFREIRKFGTELMLTTLSVERVLPCQPLPYRRTPCLHQCQLEMAAREVGCTLPYIAVANLPACRTQEQYRNSIKYVVETQSHPFTKLNITATCNSRCPKECQTQYYHITQMQETEQQNDLSLRFSSDYKLNVKEYYSQSFTKLLCELGGIIGLYVGWSVMDGGEVLITVIKALHIRISRGFERRIMGLVKPSLIISCLLLAFVLWTERLYEYVWAHPYYTSYEIRAIRSRNFPSLTVCRWPPFNLSKLVDLGLQYDIQENCRDYGRFYRCSDGTTAVLGLPGLWSKPLDDVWEASAWHLSDLVTGYELDGKFFNITNEIADGRWRAVTTEQNRCFTFTPDDAGGLTSYAVILDTAYRGEKRPRFGNNTVNLLHSSLRQENEAHTLFRLHDAREQVYSFKRDDFTGEVDYHNSLSVEFDVDLTRVTTVPRPGRECEPSPHYTREVCVAQCQASLLAELIGCRLPYLTWSPLPLCNDSYQYRKFPRRIGNREVYKPFGGDEAEADAADASCHDDCLPACTWNHYRATVTTTGSYTKKVTVKFSQSTYDVVGEEDGYTWAQLLSDVGGVAGFMMGASLLFLLHGLLALIKKLFARPSN